MAQQQQQLASMANPLAGFPPHMAQQLQMAMGMDMKNADALMAQMINPQLMQQMAMQMQMAAMHPMQMNPQMMAMMGMAQPPQPKMSAPQSLPVNSNTATISTPSLNGTQSPLQRAASSRGSTSGTPVAKRMKLEQHEAVS